MGCPLQEKSSKVPRIRRTSNGKNYESWEKKKNLQKREGSREHRKARRDQFIGK